MPLFPTQSQFYSVIQRELPEDVYPNAGDPSKFFSTSDSAAQAELFYQLYQHHETAYDNQWPQSANAAGMDQHEIMHYGDLSVGLNLAQRSARVLGKIQALPDMSRPTLRALVENELPPGTNVVFINYNQQGPSGGMQLKWRLGVSLLGIDTYLGGGMHWPAGVDICTRDPAEGGLTSEQLVEERINAGTYEVRIYGYTPTATELAAIERVLSESEKAAVQHVIIPNADPSTDPRHAYDLASEAFMPYLETDV